MVKKVVATAAVFAILANGLPAYAQIGRVFTTPVVSAEDYAKRIETCRTREEMKKGERSPFLNLSCEALVESFNENPNFDRIGDMKDHRQLADYIRTLSHELCPQNTSMQIARVVNDDDVDYFERDFKLSERCLFDGNENLYISSAVCGQWIKTPFPLYTPPRFDTSASGTPIIDTGRSVAAETEPSQAPPPPSSTPLLKRRSFWGTVVGAAIGGTALALLSRSKNENCNVNDNTNGGTPLAELLKLCD